MTAFIGPGGAARARPNTTPAPAETNTSDIAHPYWAVD
jgi:hypothetical protein